MAFNLVDVVKDQIGQEMKEHLGGLLGNESSRLDDGIATAIPGLLNGLTQRASVPGGADRLFATVNNQDDGLLDSMGSMLRGGKQNELVDMGTKVLSGLFGSSGVGTLSGIISSVSGLSKGGSSSLLGMLAPIVLGQIKKKMLGDGLNAGGLLSMLNSQQAQVQSAMPSGMLEQFKQQDFLSDIASNATAGTHAVIDEAREAGNAAAETGGGWIKKLLPVGAIAALGVVAWNYFGGTGEIQTDGQNATISEVAAQAADVDINALGTDLSDMFDNAKGSLEGITDVGSATAALPQLNELSDQFGGLTEMVDKVPEVARAPLSGIITNGLDALTPVIESVSEIPGVGEVIKPVITPIVETLQGLAG